ncbi:MAG: COX15/CtaA family protein [Gammaproteobacteria bacterium]|nr:COX15/CtaA family protein [Gammaproteobacteria bacterium]
MYLHKISIRLTQWSVCLALSVLLLGAYTRLSDAGLGCPDWPLCYGAFVPSEEVAKTQSFNVEKAWIEMIHRYSVLLLGGFIFLLLGMNFYQRKRYRMAWYLTLIVSFLLLCQAALGMWTVTLSLRPIVVLAHGLGGISIFVLLGFLVASWREPDLPHGSISTKLWKPWAFLALALLFIQISLGIWMSLQYASLACLDFPLCQGKWWPTLSFREAFDLLQGLDLAHDEADFSNAKRVTIHFMHRLGGLLSLGVIGGLAVGLFVFVRNPFWKKWGKFLGRLVILQALLGIANILSHLAVPISLLHTGTAAFLALVLVRICYFLSRVNPRSSF